MQYREATIKDIPQLCGLLEQLFTQEVEFAPNVQIQTKALKEILTNESAGKIFVTDNGIKVVAMVSILYSISTALGTKVGLLEDMIVDEKCRGQKIGPTLVEFALQKVKEDGCKRVTLLTDADNERAHKFYEDKGFARSSMVPYRIFI